jgi:hypothetical protein
MAGGELARNRKTPAGYRIAASGKTGEHTTQRTLRAVEACHHYEEREMDAISDLFFIAAVGVCAYGLVWFFTVGVYG